MTPEAPAPASPPAVANATTTGAAAPTATTTSAAAPTATTTGAAAPAATTTGTAAPAATWVASTYFAEGLPWSIIHQISAEMFTALGASLQAIGLTAFYGFATNAKGLWSPVVDMYSTTRRWIIAAEIGLAAAVALVAWPAGEGNLTRIAYALVAVAFLSATQDIAIDGFYIRALDKSSQAGFSGLRVGAFRAAMLVGKGLLVALAGLTSWRVCFLVAAGIMLFLAVLHAALLPRESRAPDAQRLRFSAAFTTLLAQPRIAATLAFILLYRAGDALMFAMSTPLLKSLGLDTTARAMLSGTLGTIASIAGSIVGGGIIARFTLARTLRPIAALQSAAILLYVWLAWARPGFFGIGVVVVLEQFLAGVGTAALMVFLMRRATGSYKTSHFAICSSLMSVATTLLGGASGFLANAVGFTAFFALAFAASIPGVLLSLKVPQE